MGAALISSVGGVRGSHQNAEECVLLGHVVCWSVL